jgi:hypothetical protein
MPNNLSRRATLLLLGVAFGLTFTVQMLLSDGASPTEPKAKRSARAAVAGAPAAEPELRLAAAGTVPALREPRRPRMPRKPRPKRTPAPKVVAAEPTVEPEPLPPAATVQPTPTAAPRYIPPRPQPQRKPAAPKPTPAPTPVPTAPPPSGDFDTSGES